MFVLYSYESTSGSNGFSNQGKSQLKPVVNTKSNVSGNPIIAKHRSTPLKTLPGPITNVPSPGVTVYLDITMWLISNKREQGSTSSLSNPPISFDLDHHLKDFDSNIYDANSFLKQFFLDNQLRLGYDKYDLYETLYI